MSDIVQMAIYARIATGEDPKAASEECWAIYDRVMAKHEAEEAIERVERERIDRQNYYKLLASIGAVAALWLVSIVALTAAVVNTL